MMVDEIFSHLSESEIKEIIELYEDNSIRVTEIIETYHLPLSNPSALYRLLPLQETNEVCEICNGELLRKVKQRSSSNNSYRICSVCSHIKEGTYGYRLCKCESCKEKRRLESEELRLERERIKQDKIKQEVALLDHCLSVRNQDKIRYENLSVKEKVYLGVILRYCISEDYTYVKPFEQKEMQMTPYQGTTLNFYKELTGRGILKPLPRLEEIKYYEKSANNNFSYEILNISYDIALYSEYLTYNEIIEEIISPIDSINYIDYYTYGEQLWKSVALEEAREYLLFSLNDARINTGDIGFKTERVLKRLIELYSVSNIYYLMWRVQKEVTSLAYKKNLPKHELFEIYIEKLEILGERAITDNWSLMEFNPLTSSGSTLSNFVYDNILGIGKDGFYKKPCIEYIDKSRFIKENEPVFLSEVFKEEPVKIAKEITYQNESERREAFKKQLEELMKAKTIK